jgi:polyisoprenoid-binding protein YceI
MFQPLALFGSLALAGALLLPTPAPSSSALAEGAFGVDPVHSTAIFSAIHFGASRFYGRFNEVTGSIEFDPAKPGDSKVTIEIDMGSVDTHDKKRDKHLRGPDFFNAKEFPTMSFTSKSVKVVQAATDEKPLVLEVEGELELAGKTRPMTATVEQVGAGRGMGGDELVGFETRFSLTRSEFGINYMVGGISDNVDVILSVEAGR